MTTTTAPLYYRTPGVLHTTLLAGSVPLFLGGLLSDIAYYQSFQIQWSNFASWLIAGGLLFSGLALLFALAGLLRGARKLYFVLLLAAWLLGLVNAFEHAKDAWAVMPAGLLLSVIVSLLACVATWVGLRTEVAP